MQICIYSGSFDPFHEGHKYVINEVSKIFDEVHVVIGQNVLKNHVFTAEERKDMISEAVPSAKVSVLDGFIADYVNELATEHRVTVVRGIRDSKDFYYENTILNNMRARTSADIRYIHVLPPEHLSGVSSSKIKDWCRQGRWECVYHYAPLVVGKALFDKVYTDCDILPEFRSRYEEIKAIFNGEKEVPNDYTCFQLREPAKVYDDVSLTQVVDLKDWWTQVYEPSEDIDKATRYFGKALEAGLIHINDAISAGQVRMMLDLSWFDPIYSRVFYLRNIPVDKVKATGNRHQSHTTSFGPIIVDINRTDFLADKGPLLVVEGKHRYLDAIERGEKEIMAWVGEEAIAYLNTVCDSENS